MHRPRDLPEIAEEEPEMLCGYPVVYTEDAIILGFTNDLMFVRLAEYHARRISEDNQAEGGSR